MKNSSRKLILIVIIFMLFLHIAIYSPMALAVNNLNVKSQQADTVKDQSQQITYQHYQLIYNHILRTTPSLGPEGAAWIAKTTLHYSHKYGVNPVLATALFTQESRFEMWTISPTGAIGIAQLQPETAQILGVDPQNPAQNIEGGIRYLAQQLATFSYAGDWSAHYAIAAYNAGPNAVKQYGGIPPYDETINHVNRVGAIYRKLDSELRYNLKKLPN
jgi:soluble lytic murein transglycosylase-like protein